MSFLSKGSKTNFVDLAMLLVTCRERLRVIEWTNFYLKAEEIVDLYMDVVKGKLNQKFMTAPSNIFRSDTIQEYCNVDYEIVQYFLFIRAYIKLDDHRSKWLTFFNKKDEKLKEIKCRLMCGFILNCILEVEEGTLFLELPPADIQSLKKMLERYHPRLIPVFDLVRKRKLYDDNDEDETKLQKLEQDQLEIDIALADLSIMLACQTFGCKNAISNYDRYFDCFHVFCTECTKLYLNLESCPFVFLFGGDRCGSRRIPRTTDRTRELESTTLLLRSGQLLSKFQRELSEHHETIKKEIHERIEEKEKEKRQNHP